MDNLYMITRCMCRVEQEIDPKFKEKETEAK
jgi:hypothetical protein